jgi:prepilin peptidase CpaA
MITVWSDSLLISILLICVITDIKHRRIYNNVIFPGLFLSFSVHFILGSWEGLQASFIGFTVGLGILLIPYFMGGMGAGDVKLLALVGALKGSIFVLYTAFYMALIGGVIALGILLFRKNIIKRFRYITYFLYGFKCGVILPVVITPETRSITYPYGVAIAGGSLLCFFIQRGLFI